MDLGQWRAVRLLGQTNHNTLHTREHAGNSSVSETQRAAGGWGGGQGKGPQGRRREMVTAEVGTSSRERASAGRHG